MTLTLRMRHAGTTIAVVVALAITGCAAGQSGFDEDVADRLQGEVLTVSQLAADADFAAAITALGELEVDVKDALARGELTNERSESILTAAALVRTDLEAAIAAATPPPPATPAPVDDGDEADNSGNGSDGKGEGKGKGDKDDKDD